MATFDQQFDSHRLGSRRLLSDLSFALEPTIENVLPFYLQKSQQGQRVCLVTVIKVDDVAPRPVGSQIAVAEDGESFGFITGGCAEAAIVHEALSLLRENQSRCIRIGSESPWFDIKLPCGAGIELHFHVADLTGEIAKLCERLSNRQPAVLRFNIESDRIWFDSASNENRKHESDTFVRQYLPVWQIAVIGAGPYIKSLVSAAEVSEFDVSVWSPETVPMMGSSIASFELTRSTRLPVQRFDRWTAAVLLFHEHDWEQKLLRAILSTECFYIGALGSRKTHAARLAKLRESGIDESQLQRIHGPVGLQINAKTPGEIAVSILAEIIKAKNSIANV